MCDPKSMIICMLLSNIPMDVFKNSNFVVNDIIITSILPLRTMAISCVNVFLSKFLKPLHVTIFGLNLGSFNKIETIVTNVSCVHTLLHFRGMLAAIEGVK